MIDKDHVRHDFVLMVNNENYDNDDNPYGKFIYHMYSNMQNLSDTSTDLLMDESLDTASVYQFEDRFIPLIDCPNPIYTSWRKSNVKQYCPDYDDGHFLYGNYYTTRFSWLRLALHFCDDTPEGKLDRIQAGKQYIDCKSREEIIDFFSSNIIALDMITESPTLGEGSAQVLA